MANKNRSTIEGSYDDEDFVEDPFLKKDWTNRNSQVQISLDDSEDDECGFKVLEFNPEEHPSAMNKPKREQISFKDFADKLDLKWLPSQDAELQYLNMLRRKQKEKNPIQTTGCGFTKIPSNKRRIDDYVKHKRYQLCSLETCLSRIGGLTLLCLVGFIIYELKITDNPWENLYTNCLILFVIYVALFTLIVLCSVFGMKKKHIPSKDFVAKWKATEDKVQRILEQRQIYCEERNV